MYYVDVLFMPSHLFCFAKTVVHRSVVFKNTFRGARHKVRWSDHDAVRTGILGMLHTRNTFPSIVEGRTEHTGDLLVASTAVSTTFLYSPKLVAWNSPMQPKAMYPSKPLPYAEMLLTRPLRSSSLFLSRTKGISGNKPLIGFLLNVSHGSR